MTDNIKQKVAIFYICSACDYNTQRKHNYDKHLLTAKHQRIVKILTNTDKNSKSSNSNEQKKSTNQHQCKCGKKYLHRQSLFTHKKECSFLQREDIYENTTSEDSSKHVVNSNIILDIIKENKEFKELIIMQSNQISKLLEREQTTIVTNNTNTNNNQFNLNFFLNETCKNAINFSDFIENIQVSTSDLENNAQYGFVHGVSQLIVDHLKQLELTERPIHCTDAKRDTIYVKEEDQWEKENSKDIIQKGIQEITRKNMCSLSEWRENHPEYEDMESELGEQSMVMQQHSMAGGKREEFYTKIIQNIAKEVALDKIKCEDKKYNHNMIK